MNYTEFLDNKKQAGYMDGFKPGFMPSFLFDFQTYLLEWGIRKGKSAFFADCGLGKTPMQLVWAENVMRHENKSVLVLAPLAVGSQTVREGEKFGIEVNKSKDGHKVTGITVTNYESLHYFDPGDFAGVVCDESSILKSFDGTRKAQITDFMRKVPYRLLCTATAAPNDYIELGTSSEALGELGYTDMLTRFFTNKESSLSGSRYKHEGGDWHFKGHAEMPFWQWVSSWARAIRKPSDFGFDNGKFILPPLEEQQTIIKARTPKPGMLFDIPAIGLAEEREVRRRTLAERCEAAAAKVVMNGNQPAVIWCHLNDEGDTLSNLIPDALQISGQDSDDAKEEKFEAFRTGQLRVLIIKPKIGAFGLNWQHCAHVVYFPSDSYEQYYQAVRRCWRFGQAKSVKVDLILTDAQERMMSNLLRKSQAAEEMFNNLRLNMNNALKIDRNKYSEQKVEVPSWLNN